MSSVTWRLATQDEIDRTHSGDRANLIDGAAAILRDGELVAITNEYNTAVWVTEGLDTTLAEGLTHHAGLIATATSPIVTDWPDRNLRVTLYLCSECDKVTSTEAWDEARWNERSRRIGQVNRGEVDAVDLNWIDPTNPASKFTSDYGLDDHTVCPSCGFIHADDDGSSVEELVGTATFKRPKSD